MTTGESGCYCMFTSEGRGQIFLILTHHFVSDSLLCRLASSRPHNGDWYQPLDVYFTGNYLCDRRHQGSVSPMYSWTYAEARPVTRYRQATYYALSSGRVQQASPRAGDFRS